MSLLEDIFKALDRWEGWKAIKATPAKVAELEKRVAALEAAINARPALEGCPICGSGTMKVISSRPDPTFGALGTLQRVLKCTNTACGHSETRMHDPT